MVKTKYPPLFVESRNTLAQKRDTLDELFCSNKFRRWDGTDEK